MTLSRPYRVQMSGSDWILRHPDQTLALLRHADKEELLKQLPAYFKKNKEPVTIKILDDFGREIDQLVLGGETMEKTKLI